MAKPIPRLSAEEIKRVIATAWTDQPPYSKVLMEHGLGQGELVQLMKRELTSTAYKMWAAQGKSAKAPTRKAQWPYGK
ncbi:DUF2805 domain-containing protein [Paucibacter sp. DJ1R-11]|jgi:uncharacterized protein (TIGR03643 family)|uniref:DUF2805 domain-containing protein n=1 Tax=unclassified Roseateles TaxID=2626991 RepID=UPI0021E3AD88|nr:MULTISPECIES: DUF2805 domain-containing protein [unclassified Roseateles]MCV2363093.1 DUF2805 domain-containing protein [Paucibacter sp. DJ1R-11]MCV2419199.1 DUF2805 domain-containing protein [Paucibacter sp. DJ4R-1]MCV2437846.1 DUF2805 domain-containing protein [Paucibacter sp. DJ2R-2]